MEITAGQRHTLGPETVNAYRVAAQHEIAENRGWAREMFGTAAPGVGVIPAGRQGSGGESLWAALESYPGWTSVEVVYRRVADHREATLLLIDEPGERTRGELGDQLDRELDNLRVVQAGPGLVRPSQFSSGPSTPP